MSRTNNTQLIFKPLMAARKVLIALSVIGFYLNGFAQVSIVPIYRDPIQDNTSPSARVKGLEPLPLPFWDDFSTNIYKTYYPNNKIWEHSNSVWVNSGMGINPPSLNVVTFDGYDSLGKPYAVNAILAKGFADKMTSAPLKLGDVATAQRSTVFISFFYQFTGHGESPEQGDALSLLFKNASGQWRQVWSVDNSGTTELKQDEFVHIVLPIAGDEYFHNNFQFRFQNFARLSGPYDTWNLDYVYVNVGRSAADKFFPDRSITTPLSNLFKQYRAIPIKHFKSDTLFTLPQFNAYNLSLVQEQPLNHTCFSQTTSYKANAVIKSTTVVLDNEDIQSGVGILSGKRRTLSLVNLPTNSFFDPTADSVVIRLKVGLNTRDNVIRTATEGDYDPAIYSPIQFRVNDTIQSSYQLADYYAYDDGVAEYGLSIDGIGTEIAYKFDMKTNEQDTIKAVDLFFPKFGDDSNQTLQLIIMGSLTGNPSDYLLKQNFAIQRRNRNDPSSNDVFMRVEFPTGVLVKGSFYVGLIKNSAAVTPIGVDANTDSGDNLYVNGSGTWVQKKNLIGSLMIRPVFGEPKVVNVGMEEGIVEKPYPNPTQGYFYLSSKAQQIHLFDLTGKEIGFEENDQFDRKQIRITNPYPGLYLVRYLDGNWRTEKIMVQP
jgi:hypothetical protein